MLRFPDISAESIVFVFAGDLWTVPREGGLARRLSSPDGMEIFPKFSPDGKTIAFSANYDGNRDIYTVPTNGGVPTRLTHHSAAETVVEWYPDGKHILYRSDMTHPLERNRFYKQSINGGLAEELPLGMAEFASFGPDENRIAFQFVSRAFRTWKRYRGGTAADLWLYDFKANTSEKITDDVANDELPMWHGNTVYFMSDRDKNMKYNIWAHDLQTKETRQVTRFDEYDIKFPSLGPDAIVFENGGQIYLLNLDDETYTPVAIQVPADLPKVRVQQKDVSGYVHSYDLSPSGKRALFEARGEIFTVPEEHGPIRNLTQTSDVAERYCSWSPDGKHVAYFSDRSGEYELCIRPGDGSGEEKQITSGGKTHRFNPIWSPDSKLIAFNDKTGRLFIVEIDDGSPVEVDKSDYSRIKTCSFSSDSRWLTYGKEVNFGISSIMIYDIENQRVHQVTSDYYSDFNPVFDPDGEYLYFYSNRTFRSVRGDMDRTWVYPNSTNLFAATLRDSVESIFKPRSDEEEVKEDDEADSEDEDEGKDDDGEDGDDDEGDKDDDEAKVEIDFDNFERRIERIPPHIGNVGGLAAVSGKVVYLVRPAAGSAHGGQPSGALKYYDLEEREEKTILSGISDYSVSADGKKVIYRSGTTYGIIDLGEGKSVGDGSLPVGQMKAWIDPREEWQQIYTDMWRTERDYFYDPDMHGVDWEKMGNRYQALMPYVPNRGDLNYVIGELIAELCVSHAYAGGGDMERAETISVGLLGCDFELDKKNNAYRFKKIYEGASWDVETRSPLRRPGIEVNEGDYLLEVNGQPVDVSKDPWAYFQGLAGEVVALTINSEAETEGAREVVVEPVTSERELRYRAWVEGNRQAVDKATDGRVGYVHVPNTAGRGQKELVRQYTPQRFKDGVIIDERFNEGGYVPDRLIEKLNRSPLNYWANRDFESDQSPGVHPAGELVMLADRFAGSGGDLFPEYFRLAGLGPIIGTRTWGGLVGISSNPRPIDNGFVSVPSFGYFNLDGEWQIEDHGVDPDYEIENLPHELAAGQDAQLEKGIEVILELIEKNPPKKVKKPAYPDRSGK